MSTKKTQLQTKGLVTNENADDIFSSDKERIKYITNNYKHLSVANSFSVYYNEKISKESKNNSKINNPVNIQLGEVYTGTVKEFTNDGISFSVVGVKEDIYTKENFADCEDHVRNYILNHNNELMFTVVKKTPKGYLVSVIDGYYKYWKKQVEKAIIQKSAINVHIDSLVRGGYMCHTVILPIAQLTGKEYTSAVFIPGSNIVLNIETNFERWLDCDVDIIPQKFTKFNFYGRPAETSLIGSRKQVLKIIGMKNTFELYNKAKLGNMPGVKYVPETLTGKVTGIINSNTKVGIFVEIEDKYITGLLPCQKSELLNYKPGDLIDVYISEFEQMEGVEPFFIDKRSVIRKCNVRPVFALAS